MKVHRPLKAIRLFCLDCVGHSPKEVANCTASSTCPLWPYRFGKRPDTAQRTMKLHPGHAASKKRNGRGPVEEA